MASGHPEDAEWAAGELSFVRCDEENGLQASSAAATTTHSPGLGRAKLHSDHGVCHFHWSDRSEITLASTAGN